MHRETVCVVKLFFPTQLSLFPWLSHALSFSLLASWERGVYSSALSCSSHKVCHVCSMLGRSAAGLCLLSGLTASALVQGLIVLIQQPTLWGHCSHSGACRSILHFASQLILLLLTYLLVKSYFFMRECSLIAAETHVNTQPDIQDLLYLRPALRQQHFSPCESLPCGPF